MMCALNKMIFMTPPHQDKSRNPEAEISYAKMGLVTEN